MAEHQETPKQFSPEVQAVYDQVTDLTEGQQEEFFQSLLEGVIPENITDSVLARMEQIVTQAKAARESVVSETVVAPEKSIEQELEEIDRSIKLRGISGKFHPGVMMHGRLLVDEESADFTSYPSQLDQLMVGYVLGESDFLIRAMSIENQLRDYYSFYKEWINRHFFIREVNSRDPSQSVVDFFFRNDHRDRVSRPSFFAHTIFIMPTEQAIKLENLIRQNPDVAEQFFQKSAAGVERSEGNPGVGRVKSDEVVILDGKEILPDQAIYRRDNKVKNNMLVKEYLHANLDSNLKTGATVLKYSRPYGVVDMPIS